MFFIENKEGEQVEDFEIDDQVLNSLTPEEKILWQYLRKRQRKGRKFLRQYPIIYETSGKEHFYFVADFYCASEKLIVELDGPIHNYKRKRDKFRDEILEQEGYRVLHIKNSEIKDLKEVLNKIEDMLL